mgnify:CR=1 FL=1
MIFKMFNHKVANILKKINSIIIISIAVLLFGTGLYFSISLPKIIAIIIMTLTSSICTILILKNNPMILMGVNDKIKEIEEKNTDTKIKNLKAQLKRAKNIGVKIANITDIHEVALKKITLNITDFKEKEISKKDLSIDIPYLGKLNNKKHIIEYKGVLSKSIVTKYGLDLSKIKILYKYGVIYISNIKPKFIGYESNEDIWNLRELRSKIEKDNTYKNYEIIFDNPKLIEEAELQEIELMNRITNNIELGGFTSIIEDANKNYIRETLFNLNIEIKFVDSLDTYIEGVNQFIESYKEDINKHLLKIIDNPKSNSNHINLELRNKAYGQ